MQELILKLTPSEINAIRTALRACPTVVFDFWKKDGELFVLMLELFIVYCKWSLPTPFSQPTVTHTQELGQSWAA